ncbi:MAG: hypothetical protein LV481_06725 [Methylacidiphilales bacterium]|nr:hypothetical protein [Candidatus Methylacidiphilales bacterium]
MIYQIANVKTKTEPLPNISNGLLQARRIQAHLKERIADGLLPENRWQSWSPMTPGPFIVPVSRWIE